MDYISLILFLIVYYVRPQEWIGPLARFRPAAVLMLVALVAMALRDRGVRLKDFFQTPHDWLMAFFFVWLIGASPSPGAVFGSVLNLLVFYVVTVQALSNLGRIRVFVWWWTGLMLLVATVAVLSEFGFDPTGAYDITHGRMKGRLILNTSIFNNPNALGHGIVPLVPMLYYMLVWRRIIFIRLWSLVLFPVPLFCLYLTQSKGSYLSGAATFLASMVFGRPKLVQLGIILVSVQIGGALLWSLPRMSEMDIGNLRAEEGMMGRLHAWKYGIESMDELQAGLGYGRWADAMNAEEEWSLASHSSYVQVGGELGLTGLFLYLGVLYASLRTLVSARCSTDEEERLRRCLFAAVVAFACSSWLVNFTYRATFFYQAGVVAAFHRHLLRLSPDNGDDETAPDEPPRILFGWNRLGLVDAALIAVLTSVVVGFWRHAVYSNTM